MKKIFTVAVLLVCVVTSVLFGGCNLIKDNEELLYNEYPTDYDADVNSWEQIAVDDEPVDITWFSNYSYSVHQSVVELIAERTGVTVNFVSASDDRNTELNKWIVDNSLPDVIGVGDEATIAQLSQEGYVYKINRLAESYAPSMLKRIPEDMHDYYRDEDGDMFAVGHSFYTEKDMEEFEAVGGKQFTSFDCLVRKDYLEAYISYKKTQDPDFDEDTITRASNFIEMCKWVKTNFDIPNTKPTVMIFNTESTARFDIYNYTLEALMDFFCVPREDAAGNYINRYDTPEFQEVIKFLNTLYKNRLICSANINYTLANCQSNAQRGDPFAIIGTGQQVTNHIKNLEISGYDESSKTVDDSNQYVSILLTNDRGDAPLITDYSVKGRYAIMITNNCKRPDRVIKVFDYLMSEQGQRELYYGVEEGANFNYEVQPGGKYPGTDIVATYGVVEWTDSAVAVMKGNNMATLYSLGMQRTVPLTNQIYKRMTSAETNYSGVTNLASWIEYKMKCTYFDYAYSQFPFRFPIDRSDRNALNAYLDKQASIDNTWIEYFARMIMADNNDKAIQEYNVALAAIKQKGYEEWLEFRNRNFKAYKEKLGITYAWPKADPSYVAPEVTLYGSYEKYIFEVPASVSWNQ